MSKNKTTESRSVYKPLSFPWAVEATQKQQSMHWVPQEVSMQADLIDFNQKLTYQERDIIIKILRFFTQTDIEVARSYIQYYAPVFKDLDIMMMIITFASMEVIHIQAYAYLNDNLQLPDTEYAEFFKYKEMTDKYDYMHSFKIDNKYNIALNLAVVSGFIEGFVLFSSFIILASFSNMRGRYENLETTMQGVGQIIAWSVRDESLHSASIIKLFHVYVAENNLSLQQLHQDILKEFHILFEHEVAFIDLVFTDLPYLKKADLIAFIKYLADIRLQQLGIKTVFNITENPLPWTYEFLFPREIANFFEVRPTSYSKADFTEENISDDYWVNLQV